MYLRIADMLRYPAVIKCEYRRLSSSLMQVEKNDNTVSKKMNEFITWYEQITGMDQVHAAQNRVLEEEKKLANAQEHRREINKLVTAVQAKLRELHSELDSTPRGDDKYVQLITQEHRLLKEERQLTLELQQYEREERDYFTALSSAVKESHEKERAQAERTKYWSIIGSVIGTVIGIAGSSLNNHFKLRKFEKLVKESLEEARMSSGNIPELLHKQDKQLHELVSEIKALGVLPSRTFLSQKVPESGLSEKIDKVLRLLDQQQAVLQNRFKELEVFVKKVTNVPSAAQSQPLYKNSVVPTYQPEFKEGYVEAAIGIGLTVFVVAILCHCCRALLYRITGLQRLMDSPSKKKVQSAGKLMDCYILIDLIELA